MPENINDKNYNLINKNSRKSNNDESICIQCKSAVDAQVQKEFRTFQRNTSFNNESKSNSDGLLYSKIDFLKNNAVDSTNIIDQRNLIDYENNSFNTRIAYTEPLMKDVYMEINYGFNYNNGLTTERFWQKSPTGYDKKDRFTK